MDPDYFNDSDYITSPPACTEMKKEGGSLPSGGGLTLAAIPLRKDAIKQNASFYFQ